MNNNHNVNNNCGTNQTANQHVDGDSRQQTMTNNNER